MLVASLPSTVALQVMSLSPSVQNMFRMRSLSGVTWHLGNKNNRKVEQIELERVIGKIQSTLPVYIKDI